MNTFNTATPKRFEIPANLKDLTKQQEILEHCIKNKIDDVLIPELENHEYMDGKWSLTDWAIYTGQTILLERLKEIDQLTINIQEAPPIIVAACFGNLNIMTWLVDKGFSQWTDTYQNAGILYYAVMFGEPTLARELVRLGYSSWDETPPPGSSLALVALCSEDFELVTKLRAKGHALSVTTSRADILGSPTNLERLDCYDNEKLDALLSEIITISPMAYAAMRGSEKALRWLVAENLGDWHEKNHLIGVYDSAVNSSNFGTLVMFDIGSILYWFNHSTLWQKLYDEGLVSELSENQVLACACRYFGERDLEALELLSSFTDIKEIEKNKALLINIAIRSLNKVAVDWLVEHDFSAWDHVYESIFGYKIFHFAVEEGFIELIDWLIQEGHNTWQDRSAPTPQRPEGRTALCIAIMGQQFELVKKLISENIFDGITPNNNMTPFELSLGFGDAAFIQWLVTNNYGRWTDVFSGGNTILHIMGLDHNLEPILEVASLSGLGFDVKNACLETPLQCIFRQSGLPKPGLYSRIFDIANAYPEAIYEQSIQGSFPLFMSLHSKAWPLYEGFLHIVKKNNLQLPSDIIEQAIIKLETIYTELLLDLDLAESENLSTLQGFIDNSKGLNTELLKAEYVLREASLSPQHLHLSAERFIYQAMKNPRVSLDFATRLFLATIPDKTHEAFRLRVMPQLNECLNQVTFDRCQRRATIENQALQIIRGFASKGCFYLQDKNKNVLFSYQNSQTRMGTPRLEQDSPDISPKP